jgi:hypothetical protein
MRLGRARGSCREGQLQLITGRDIRGPRRPIVSVSVASLLSLCFIVLFPHPVASADGCANAGFRVGPSADLPDCRVYELVTPQASNGRRFADVKTVITYDLFPTELFSPLHESFVFATVGSSLQVPVGGNGRTDSDVYEAGRAASGWQILRHVTPSGDEAVAPFSGGVSSDHGYTFVHVPTFGGTGEYGSLAREGEADYLGDRDGMFELTGVGSLGAEPLAQGRYISLGGEHVIFTTGRLPGGSQWCANVGPSCPVRRLESKAPPTGTGAVYDRAANGPTRVVSLLPGDLTPLGGEDAGYQGASSDGTAVAFKIAGALYVRKENAETMKVTEDPSTYGGLSADGTWLFYVSDGNIFRFNTGSGQKQQVNSSGDGQIVNICADGSHVFFISLKQLDALEGTEGQPNMYVWSGDETDYIATVAPSDLERTSGEIPAYPALSHWTSWVVSPLVSGGPGADSSRTTPDGSVIIFESRAQLTAYKNSDYTEIYHYNVESKTLRCVSCSPTGAPAAADSQLEDLEKIAPTTVISNLSEDGRRVFFETSEPLMSRDVDQINDIYEWKLPVGEAPKIDLISPGTSTLYESELNGGVTPKPNVLLGIAPNGSDVFFASQDALVPGAGTGGASAIYDARVDGGFQAGAVVPACGEGNCRGGSYTVPSLSNPRSEARVRAGNVKARRHGCSRRKHRQRGRGHDRCAHHKKPRG